jgi:serine/threonine protein phosphatase PrpC
MNEADEQYENAPEIKVKTFESPTEPDENLMSVEAKIPATAQIVSDIPALPPVKALENSPLVESDEDATHLPATQPQSLEVSKVSEPSETGSYQLDNAMVGRPYKAEFDLKELKIEQSTLLPNFEGQIAALGLSLKREGDILQIDGNPLSDAQGEHALVLDYTYDEQRIHRKKFTLLINPDPKSLWKNIEPEEDLPYRKEHTATEQIANEDFNIIAASLRGRSHAHEGKFREDDFTIKMSGSGWHIVIVADGAGSAKFSRQGSLLACQTTLKSLEKSIAELLEPSFAELVGEFASAKTEQSEKEIKNLLYQVLCGAAFASYKRLEQESADTENPIKDYSTTLLFSIVKKFDSKTFIASFGIGDGAIGVYDQPNNTVKLMISPDGGEFSGQTRFLTMREVIGDGSEMLRRIKFNVFDKFTMLALMTDGIADPKFGTDNNLVAPEKWCELYSELQAEVDFNRGNKKAAEQLLEYMDFWSAGEHDDRTLAILY